MPPPGSWPWIVPFAGLIFGPAGCFGTAAAVADFVDFVAVFWNFAGFAVDSAAVVAVTAGFGSSVFAAIDFVYFVDSVGFADFAGSVVVAAAVV